MIKELSNVAQVSYWYNERWGGMHSRALAVGGHWAAAEYRIGKQPESRELGCLKQITC
jgi:hypothetical protein